MQLETSILDFRCIGPGSNILDPYSAHSRTAKPTWHSKAIFLNSLLGVPDVRQAVAHVELHVEHVASIHSTTAIYNIIITFSCPTERSELLKTTKMGSDYYKRQNAWAVGVAVIM